MLETRGTRPLPLNLIGALCLTPAGRHLKLQIQSYWESLTGEHLLRFPKHLLRRGSGPVVLIWDKHPIHKRKHAPHFPGKRPRLDVQCSDLRAGAHSDGVRL